MEYTERHIEALTLFARDNGVKEFSVITLNDRDIIAESLDLVDQGYVKRELIQVDGYIEPRIFYSITPKGLKGFSKIKKYADKKL